MSKLFMQSGQGWTSTGNGSAHDAGVHSTQKFKRCLRIMATGHCLSGSHAIRFMRCVSDMLLALRNLAMAGLSLRCLRLRG